MLINVGNKEKVLPKLKTEKSSSKKQARRRKVLDDSASVRARMEELFGKYDWKVVTNKEDLIRFLDTAEEFGFDTETTSLDIFKGELVGLSFGTLDKCIYVPLRHKVGMNYRGDIKEIESILAEKKLFGFNSKFDMKALKLHANLNVKSEWCGYLAARLMNSAEPANNLKDLYVKYVDPFDETYSFKNLFNKPFDEYDPLIVGGYAAVDAMKHLRLGKWQQANMSENDLKLMYKLEMPLTHDLVDIELTGIKLDIDWCNKLIEELNNELEEIMAELAVEYPGLNPGSPKQVAEWIYDKLKLLDPSNGRGTGEALLSQLDHPLAEKILRYRKAQKMLSTYAAKMPADADDGIIHTTFNQYGADTGRFSSSDPNLQNIPRDPKFRKMFTAREGHMLVSCDYTQQEVYILASLANDATMKEAYSRGADFYAYMASIVFERPYEDCVKGGKHGYLRDQMKSIVLGINYDMGLSSLARGIGKSIAETKEIYERFFTMCPRIKPFREERLKIAKEHGYVETILGRKRRLSALHLPDFECEDKEIEKFLNTATNEYVIEKLIEDARAQGIRVIDRRAQKAYETRQVVNSAVQGSAADMTKLAIVVANRDEKLKELGCKILMQIHDEIVAEFPEETAEEGGKRLAEIMKDVGTDLIEIEMKVTPTIMKSWE